MCTVFQQGNLFGEYHLEDQEGDGKITLGNTWGWEADRNCSGSCPMANFSISNTEPSVLLLHCSSVNLYNK